MDKPGSCFLPEALPEIDISGLSITATPGKCAVLMDRERTTFGLIHLPDKVQGRLRADVGRVVHATGPKSGWDGSILPIGIKAGDYVLVRPYDGAWINDFHDGRQIRFYGIAKDDEGLPVSVPWDDSIIARWNGEDWGPVGGNWLVQRSKKTGQFMIEELAKWDDCGTVLAVGETKDAGEIGGTVYFKEEGPQDLVHLEFSAQPDLFIVHRDYALVAA